MKATTQQLMKKTHQPRGSKISITDLKQIRGGTNTGSLTSTGGGGSQHSSALWANPYV